MRVFQSAELEGFVYFSLFVVIIIGIYYLNIPVFDHAIDSRQKMRYGNSIAPRRKSIFSASRFISSKNSQLSLRQICFQKIVPRLNIAPSIIEKRYCSTKSEWVSEELDTKSMNRSQWFFSYMLNVDRILLAGYLIFKVKKKSMITINFTSVSEDT